MLNPTSLFRPFRAYSRRVGNLKPIQLISVKALGLLVPASLLGLSANAAPLSDGQSFFKHPPRLLQATTSISGTGLPGATYQFTINIPENAGEPLKAVTIGHAEREDLDTVVFKYDESHAFAGASSAGGPQVPLSSIGGSQSLSNEVTAAFDPPVLPGRTVTIVLKPQRNPTKAGIYLFGVTAYPVGESSLGQFLGYSQLQFVHSMK